MRVLLIFPRFRYPSGDPPLGVAYLAASLREAGHEPYIFDGTFSRRPVDDLRRLLREREFDLVGCTVLTSMLDSAAEVFRTCAKYSHSPVIAGGPHATVMPQQTLGLEGVDAVLVGEGEETFVQMADLGGDYTQVPGFWYHENGGIAHTDPASPIEDINAIPFPARDLLDMARYMEIWYQLDAVKYGLRGTSILGSRGCPYNCAYCQPTLRKIFGRQVRFRSPENIVTELQQLKSNYNPDGVMWLDDTFLIDQDWMRDLCDRIIEADLDMIWGCNIRADRADREILAYMQRAGLRIVHVGIESASQRVLDDIYHKGITIEQVKHTVTTAHDLGLNVRGYFMLGAPTETEEELWKTVQLANRLPLDDVSFSITTPLPHTHLYEETKHLIDSDFSEFDYYKRAVYKEDAIINRRKLDWIKKWAYLKFYLGPRRLWRTIKSVLGISGIRKMLLKIQRF
ncbi:MAG: B12-binding domain-containing radical SAM protein [Armatimonadota bacterium]